jgi:hypothetical protein
MMSVRLSCSAVIRGLSINDLARVECVLDNNDADDEEDDDDDDDDDDEEDCCVFVVK